jgi:signal transduction histidine kinase
MMLFPERVGLAWIGVFILITGISLYLVEDLQSMLISLPIYSGGFIFFAAFALQTVQAEKARAKSDELLQDLKAAHLQLQNYARQAEEFAVAEERNRLAREMHDTIGHRLTVSAVQLEGAQRLIPSDPARAEKMVGTVRAQVREALVELRAAVARLRAPLEADLGLAQALDRLSTSFSAATGITVHVAVSEKFPALPDAHRLALYRSAQEALTNIQKHARATEAWLSLALKDDMVELAIMDDGIGLLGTPTDGGFGLVGLRERAARVGGELLLTSREGGGTRITINLPREGASFG